MEATPPEGPPSQPQPLVPAEPAAPDTVGGFPVETREPHPVELVVTDDLHRSRLTVFFRLPIFYVVHYVWFWFWSFASIFVWFANWIFTLILGRSPEMLREFLGAYLRYSLHLFSYMSFMADPLPGWLAIRQYPVDTQVPSECQRRLITLFRPILAIPAVLLSWVFLVVVYVLAFIGWFVCLILGRIPKGMRDLGLYCLRYETQTRAYLTFLTDRYPTLNAPKL
jgi:Domain of unknown function (DUF4389)